MTQEEILNAMIEDFGYIPNPEHCPLQFSYFVKMVMYKYRKTNTGEEEC